MAFPCVVVLLLLSCSAISAVENQPALGRRSLLQTCPAATPNLCFNADGSRSICCPTPGGCGPNIGSAATCQKTVEFAEIGAGPYERFQATNSIIVNGEPLPQPFKVVLESNMNYGGYQFAQVLNFNGAPIGGSGAANRVAAFDRTSLFEEFGKVWAVTQNEQVAGSMYITELSQGMNGTLTPVRTQFVRQNTIFGMWRPCSGTLTPWKTHLGGEENTPQSRGYPNLVWGQNLANAARRGRPYTDAGLADQARVHVLTNPNDISPYWFGWAVEVDVTNAAGDYTVAKRYALGRSAKEMLIVMPDQQTVYISEDMSSNGGLYLFKATVPGDLRRGTLYAAKWIQTSASNGGSARIEWIKLNPEGGDVDESLAAQALAGRTFNETSARFENIFDYIEPTYQAGTNISDTPPAGFRSVVTEPDGIHEWLRLKPGQGPLASLLETRRMAAYVGATVEFSKFEGMAYDSLSNSLFVAATTVSGSMLDNRNIRGSLDAGGPNDVRLEQIPGGVVYRMNCQYNEAIGSNYVAADMYPELISPPSALNRATGEISVDEIQAPDNLGIDVDARILYINEDGGAHPNAYLWAHNLITKEKKRIYAATDGAEVTSGYYFPNVGSNSYLMATSQGVYPAYIGYWTFPRDQPEARPN